MTGEPANGPRQPRWRRVALALAGFKLGYGLVVLGMAWWGAAFDEGQAERIRRNWFPAEAPPAAHGRWARHLATWDAEHYLYLSAHGYTSGLRSAAFYPLWPLAVRAAAPLAGGSHLVAGLVLANVFSLAGWVLFHRTAARRWGERRADLALALLLAFPGSLFFQFAYSEALFFLLLMGLWWGLERRHLPVALAAAVLLPMTRGLGVFAVLPITWHAARESGLGERVWRLVPWGSKGTAGAGNGEQPEFRDPGLKFSLRPWLVTAAPLLGWGLYLALMWWWTGNPWEGMQAQRHWGVHAISNLWDVPKFVGGFLEVTTGHGFTGSLLDRLVFLLVLYSLPMQWRLGRDLPVWTLMLGVVPALSGTLVSFVRFASCVFPVFLAGAAVLDTGLGRRPMVVVLVAAGALHGWLLWRFLNYAWAG